MGKELGSILQLEVLCEGLAEQPVDGCRVGSIAHFLQPLLLCIFRHCCKRVLTHVDCHSHTSTARWGKMFSHQCKEEERQGRGQSLREREQERARERERGKDRDRQRERERVRETQTTKGQKENLKQDKERTQQRCKNKKCKSEHALDRRTPHAGNHSQTSPHYSL